MTQAIYNDLKTIEYTNSNGVICQCKYIGRIGYETHFGLNDKYELIVWFESAKNALDELVRIRQNHVFEKLKKVLAKDYDDYEWSGIYLLGKVNINGKNKYLGYINGGASGLCLNDEIKG